ncbi:MAG: hypothetical protein GC201_18425 [Alphaproteobacteria bacterium]|nr:hypothetical protein [Alphaproteobacteria bacterium]
MMNFVTPEGTSHCRLRKANILVEWYMRACLLFSVFMLLLTMPFRRATAAPEQCARALLQAHQGKPAAQFEVGLCYAWGEGFERDYDQAEYWVEKAADQGYANAQFALGPLFVQGMDVTADHVEALKLYSKALDSGDATLNANPAQLTQDFARWYRKSADQGDAHAQRGLALLYANGLGVLQDYTEAEFWLSLSVNRLGWNPERLRDTTSNGFVKTCTEIEAHLTDDQLEAVRKRVKNWKAVSTQ